MPDNVEGIRRKLKGITKIESVVKTMKILAAANVSQYEAALTALDYYRIPIELGLSWYFKKQFGQSAEIPFKKALEKRHHLIVYGSDLGLVGQFNDLVFHHVLDHLKDLDGEVVLWAVGERIYIKLEEEGLSPKEMHAVPNSVDAIAGLVNQILLDWETFALPDRENELYVVYNHLMPGRHCEPVFYRIMPFDQKLLNRFYAVPWPTNKLPEVLDDETLTFEALIREFIFMSLYWACTDSLASENVSRLASMQRAEKNIDEMMDTVGRNLQLLRQKNIDEEIFDVISGAEKLLEEVENK